LDKAPDAFRTISEVAEEINVPQHVLRFWESRFAQIKPMKRGGGRRYYRPDDVDLLRGVRHLLYGEGYTIRGVQRLLREEGVGFVQSVGREGGKAPPYSEEDRARENEAEQQVVAGSEDEPSPLGILSARADAGVAATSARREPTFSPAPSEAPQRRRINDEDRRKLKSALDELVACRRLIEAALSQDFSEQGNGRSGEI
jgi:DNA-binding transcriptional MerR regulator